MDDRELQEAYNTAQKSLQSYIDMQQESYVEQMKREQILHTQKQQLEVQKLNAIIKEKEIENNEFRTALKQHGVKQESTEFKNTLKIEKL